MVKLLDKDKVTILISTYNGYKYLEEQYNSLINQKYPNIEIIFRDDGSTDDSIGIIENYCQHCNVSLLLGANCGARNSFLCLISQSSVDSSYYAFCDQDDVWESDKLSRAVEQLSKLPEDIPAMYSPKPPNHLGQLDLKLI